MSYNRDILQAFEAIGLQLVNERLPDEGFPQSSLGPHTVWVKPKPPAVIDRNYRRAAKHRAMIRCGHCGRELSLGRLQQHLKRKDHQ